MPKQHAILFRIERRRPGKSFISLHVINYEKYTCKIERISDFVEIRPLTSHSWVKYWSRIQQTTTNREHLSIASRWLFQLRHTTLSLEKSEGVAHPPSLVPSRMVKWPAPARDKERYCTFLARTETVVSMMHFRSFMILQIQWRVIFGFRPFSSFCHLQPFSKPSLTWFCLP